MIQCELVLVRFLIGPLEIGARIVVKVVGTLEERSIKVGLGSAHVEKLWTRTRNK